jgi:hypothetical protein
LFPDHDPINLTSKPFEDVNSAVEAKVLNKYFIACYVEDCDEICVFHDIFELLQDVHDDIQQEDPEILYLRGYPGCEKVADKNFPHLCSHISRCHFQSEWLCAFKDCIRSREDHVLSTGDSRVPHIDKSHKTKVGDRGRCKVAGSMYVNLNQKASTVE